MTFQAAAQDNLTESQVRSIVEGALESNAKKAGKTSSISSLYGPRFEMVQAPEEKFTLFKLDKETGETWVINTSGKMTSSKKLLRPMGGEDEVRPGEYNYQLIADSWYHVFLLNVHTGTLWEAEYKSGKRPTGRILRWWRRGNNPCHRAHIRCRKQQRFSSLAEANIYT